MPESVSKLHNYPLIRISRVIGGISVVLFLASPDWITNSKIYWLIFVFAIIQLLYMTIINIIKFIYLVYLWKNKKLEVRNSPIDQIGYLALKLAACIKGACVAGAGTATVLGLGFGVDKLLEQGGYPPVFKKALGNQLGKALHGIGYEGNPEYLELKNKILEIKT